MDNWQQDWTKSLEILVDQVGQFFQEVGKEMSEAADALIELTEEIADTLEETIAPGFEELDQQISEWVDPILHALLGLEETIDQAVEPVTHTVEPWLNQHPVCVGCRHYHGQSYNGVMFVCAMHPYGMEQDVETCPDKELFPWALPPSLSNWTNDQTSNQTNDQTNNQTNDQTNEHNEHNNQNEDDRS